MDYKKKYLKYKKKYLKYNISGGSLEKYKQIEENLFEILDQYYQEFRAKNYHIIFDNHKKTTELIEKYINLSQNLEQNISSENNMKIELYKRSISKIKNWLIERVDAVYTSDLHTKYSDNSKILPFETGEIIIFLDKFIGMNKFLQEYSQNIINIFENNEHEDFNKKIASIEESNKIGMLFEAIIQKFMLQDITTFENLKKKLKLANHPSYRYFKLNLSYLNNWLSSKKEKTNIYDLISFDFSSMSFKDILKQYFVYMYEDFNQEFNILLEMFRDNYYVHIMNNLTIPHSDELSIYKKKFFDELLSDFIFNHVVDYETKSRLLEYIYNFLKAMKEIYQKEINEPLNDGMYHWFTKYFNIVGKIFYIVNDLPAIYFDLSSTFKSKLINMIFDIKVEHIIENTGLESFNEKLEKYKKIYETLWQYHEKFELTKYKYTPSEWEDSKIKEIEAIKTKPDLLLIEAKGKIDNSMKEALKNYTETLINILAGQVGKTFEKELIENEKKEKGADKAKTERESRDKKIEKQIMKLHTILQKRDRRIKRENIDSYLDKLKKEYKFESDKENELKSTIKTKFNEIINNSEYIFPQKVLKLKNLIEQYDDKIDWIIQIAIEREKEQEGEEEKKEAKSIINLIESNYLNNKLNKVLNTHNVKKNFESLGFYLSDSDSSYLKSTDTLTYITFKRIEKDININRLTKLYNESIHAHIGIDDRMQNYDVLGDELGTQGRISLTLTCNIKKISNKETIVENITDSYMEYFSEPTVNGYAVVGNPRDDKKSITIDNDKLHINILGRSSILFAVNDNIDDYIMWIKQYMEFLKIVPVLLITV